VILYSSLPDKLWRNRTLSDQDRALEEKNLVRACTEARSTSAATFDQLRLENYASATTGIVALSTTSSVIGGHIHRAAFLAFLANCS